MERPWWMLAFLLPLCCGSTFLAFLLGAGGGSLLGGLIFGVLLPGPAGALVFGGLMGVTFAVPLIVIADRDLRRKGDACAIER